MNNWILAGLILMIGVQVVDGVIMEAVLLVMQTVCLLIGAVLAIKDN